MAAGRTNKHKSQDETTKVASSKGTTTDDPSNVQKPSNPSKGATALAEEHLPPLSLVFCVFFLSGPLFVLGLRDFLATGRVLVGPLGDDAFQQFTDSNFFFDSADWKSSQGGLSAIQAITTDANNMGGLFVRKLGGAAGAIVHLQKLLPLLFHPEGAQWMAGHFKPLYGMALAANLALATFYGMYLPDLKDSRADQFPKIIMGLLVVESLVLLYHLLLATTPKQQTRLPAIAMPEGKTPQSVASRIVARTVAVVTSVITLIAGRELFFPGTILEFIPRDDIYLEWTNALLHSPPAGSVELEEQGLEAALYIGDKFVSQLMALNLLILCGYKFLTAFFIQFGSDGSGQVKCKMIWKAQCIGDMMLVLMMRLFSSAALSASLDFRWHLMLVAYEGFILGLYAWF
ncbi:expressed unknown protein [Seminavis robusta]|uniref:Uncharacterized protein n=1 Tax=Seminavis robusta TaxID=568900 RepID=A0A9N8E087_9STRA|nr:expressed unknown protein [Seminavis robusta]|eukprot:Sro382_g131090.1 n/a (402) ;mRNA; f:37126-38582